MTESTEKVLKELSQFLQCTPAEELHRPAVALTHIREMVARACSEMPDGSDSLLPLSIGLERITLNAQKTRHVDTYVIASLTGLELGVTVSAALLHRPDWETFLGAAATLAIMALTEPGINWKVNRQINGSLENLLAIGRFADLVASVQLESGPGNTSFEPSGNVPTSGL